MSKKTVMSTIIEKYKNTPKPAKAALWFVFCTLLQKGIAFITIPIFTRLMPTEEYGIYNTYLSWYSILTVICTLNIHNCAYVNGITKANSEEEKDRIAIPLLSLSSVITILVFLVYFFTHQWLDKWIGLPTIIVYLIFAQIFFEPPVLFWSMKQRYEYKYIPLIVITLLMVVSNTFLGIIFVYIDTNNAAVARVLSIVIVQMIVGGALFLLFFKRGKQFFSTKGWEHALVVQLPLVPHGLSLTVLSSSDRIMINNLIGSTPAAIYGVAYSAGFAVNVLKTSMVDALRPWIYEKIKHKQFDELREKTKPILVLVMLITFFFIAFAPEIITIMAPEGYREAIYVIPPVAASTFFTFLYNIFSAVSFYFEKTKKIMYASVSGALMNLILNYIFIRMFGYIAAAYTTMLCYMFFSLAHYLIMKGICKKELNRTTIFDMKFITILGFFVIIMTIGFSFIYRNIYIRYGFMAVMIALLIVCRKEIKEAMRMIRRKGRNENERDDLRGIEENRN